MECFFVFSTCKQSYFGYLIYKPGMCLMENNSKEKEEKENTPPSKGNIKNILYVILYIYIGFFFALDDP